MGTLGFCGEREGGRVRGLYSEVMAGLSTPITQVNIFLNEGQLPLPYRTSVWRCRTRRSTSAYRPRCLVPSKKTPNSLQSDSELVRQFVH
jgi:hypothetical protein